MHKGLAFGHARLWAMRAQDGVARFPKLTKGLGILAGGPVELAHHGAYGVSLIILVASVVIPLAKFWAIAYLAISVKTRLPAGNHSRQVMYEIVEYIGRWSMIDIFVVAILSSLVQLKTLATINPGPASMFFALSVIFTMLSAQAFDSRLIWDQEAKDRGPQQDV